MPQLSEQQLTPEQEGLIREMFQKAYEMVYEKGAFDTLIESAEKSGVEPAVSLLAGNIMDRIIKQSGITDVTVLFTIGALVVTDLVNALAEAGIDAKEEDIPASIQKVIGSTLAANPEFAQAIASDPNVSAMLKQVQGAGGGQPQPEQAQAPAQEEQGVL